MFLKTPYRTFLSSICKVLLIAVLVTNAFGWNRPGHMTTGAIAFADLQARDPAAARRAVEILKMFCLEPFRTSVERAPQGTDEGLALFILAARWPDDIRDTPDDHPTWHFTNRPFKPDGEPAGIQTQPPADVNIETAFNENMRILENPASWGSDRAKALAWIFHLTGDSHQPLHSTALFTSTFPDGDRGGTIFFIRRVAGGPTSNLHGLWDSAVISTPPDDFQSVINRATELRNKFPRSSLNNLSEDDIGDWITESFDMARETTYRNGSLKGSRDRNNGKVLPDDYVSTITPQAERRLVMAGYRLSDLLSRLF
jgi:hypothetical protein